MRLLGLDTATRATTVAVWDTASDQVVEQRDDPPVGARPRHTTHLLTLAARALAQAGADWTAIDRIAVGTGPGTFTGIRIGVSTARALAASLGCEIAGVSTLRAVASRADGSAPEGARTIAVLDARRGEVFAAAWPRGAAHELTAGPLIAPAALAPEQLARTLAERGGSWWAVGDGAVAFRHVLDGAGVVIADDDSALHRVSAREICRLGRSAAAVAPGEVLPDYLRLPDAELSRRARDGGEGVPPR